jgi:predicted nucleotidyltransferase
VVLGGIRVASLGHLLVLKLEAFADRRGSTKGDKDAKDLYED